MIFFYSHKPLVVRVYSFQVILRHNLPTDQSSSALQEEIQQFSRNTVRHPETNAVRFLAHFELLRRQIGTRNVGFRGRKGSYFLYPRAYIFFVECEVEYVSRKISVR